MTSTLLSRPDELVAQWRTSAEDDNPAGPLFSHGYAEFDVTTSEVAYTTLGCSVCTHSGRVECC